MKKVIALFMVMAMFSTTVFAAPLSVTGSLDEPSKEGYFSSLNDEYDLFADVTAVALTQEEAQAVEGEGWFNSLISGLIGATVGGIAGAAIGGSVSLGILSIPGWVTGAIAGGVSSAIAAYPTNDIAINISARK